MAAVCASVVFLLRVKQHILLRTSESDRLGCSKLLLKHTPTFCSVCRQTESPSRLVIDKFKFQSLMSASGRITAENMNKSQHTNFTKDTTNEGASMACSNVRL